jgi:hypothetical protein
VLATRGSGAEIATGGGDGEREMGGSECRALRSEAGGGSEMRTAESCPLARRTNGS